MKTIYKPNEFASMLNVKVKTLQNLDNANKLMLTETHKEEGSIRTKTKKIQEDEKLEESL